MKRCLGAFVALVSIFGALLLTTGVAQAAKKDKPLVVCKFGCKYKTIQNAVDASKKNATIQVEPGKYKEAVLVEGHKHDGLTIEGTTKKASKVILEGKNAKTPDGPAQNGIQAVDVNDVTVQNLTARNYLANGIFLRDSEPGDTGNGKIDCNDYTVKNVVVSFNRSYGVYAFGCAGGKITKSTGFGHGDSAFYIGATPVQPKPKTTKLDKLEAYENVLGYSGTNSRYVEITRGDWYNNGIGIVPNTLDSEPFEPTADSVIEDNNIFWNNFNYFLPNSRVKTVSNGLGEIEGVGTLQYPTGVGVALFGADGWVVENNRIFGNFKYGAAAFSDPFNEGDDATSMNNQFLNNTMGAGGTDTNAVDFWADGSGTGNCFSGNTSSTFDPSPSATNAELYPGCPTSGTSPGATGTSFGNIDQVSELVEYVTTDPPEKQECSWTRHDHPAFEKFKPLTVTPGPTCP